MKKKFISLESFLSNIDHDNNILDVSPRGVYYIYNDSIDPILIKENNRVIFEVQFGQVMLMNGYKNKVFAVLGKIVYNSSGKARYQLHSIENVVKPILVMNYLNIGDTIVRYNDLEKVEKLRRDKILKKVEEYPDIKNLVDKCPYKIPEELIFDYYQYFIRMGIREGTTIYEDFGDGFYYPSNAKKVGDYLYIEYQHYLKSNINGWFYHKIELWKKDLDKLETTFVQEKFIGIELHEEVDFIKRDAPLIPLLLVFAKEKMRVGYLNKK